MRWILVALYCNIEFHEHWKILFCAITRLPELAQSHSLSKLGKGCKADAAIEANTQCARCITIVFVYVWQRLYDH